MRSVTRAERVADHADARDEAVWEDEALDEVDRLAGLRVVLVWIASPAAASRHGPRAARNTSTGRCRGSSRRPPRSSRSRSRLVVAGRAGIAVVLEQQRGCDRRSRGADTSRAPVVLRLRDRGGGHPAPEFAAAWIREAAPAGADLDHAWLDGPEVELAADRRRTWRARPAPASRPASRRCRRNRPSSGRASAGRVVAEVVVRGDVARCRCGCCSSGAGTNARNGWLTIDQRLSRPFMSSRLTTNSRTARSGRRAPVAADVGLAGADGAAEGGVSVHLQDGRRDRHREVAASSGRSREFGTGSTRAGSPLTSAALNWPT